MDRNVAKSIIQNAAMKALIEKKGGIALLATGSGKAKLAIDYIIEMERIKQKELKILLVVPTQKLRDANWKIEFDKWSNNIYHRIDRYCYASINKLNRTYYDIVILDEIQNITPLNSEFFDNNNAHRIIGLTATMPKEKEKMEIINSLGLKIAYSLSMDEAVKRNVIAPYKIQVYKINPDTDTKYIMSGSKTKRFLQTEREKYNYLTNKLDDIKNGYKTGSFKFTSLERMRLIYNFKSKIAVSKYLLDNVIPNEDKGLIFAGSIATAVELESRTFHSKTNSKDFDDFMNDKINRLSSVKALNEGINIPNLDFGLIHQITSKERHLIQRIGRIVRYRPNHMAKIYIVVAANTVDEQWLASALEGIDPANIKYFNVNIKANDK